MSQSTESLKLRLSGLRTEFAAFRGDSRARRQQQLLSRVSIATFNTEQASRQNVEYSRLIEQTAQLLKSLKAAQRTNAGNMMSGSLAVMLNELRTLEVSDAVINRVIAAARQDAWAQTPATANPTNQEKQS